MAIYLKHFSLPSQEREASLIEDLYQSCFDSVYPFNLFPLEKNLQEIEFEDVTIFSGGNGTGKSTLLNIIAEKIEIERESMFNKTYFFEPYVQACYADWNLRNEFKIHEVMNVSKIITSDDVFNHILKVRDRNENLSFKRDVIFRRKSEMNRGTFNGPTGFSADDPESIREYLEYGKLARKKMSASRYVRQNVGVDERTYSNGENGFRYFADAIQPGGLYLLDEPENSLSAEMQLELVEYIQAMARFYNCQFILSSHSPFILSMPFAQIYNFDEEPIKTCKWTELPNVRIYYEFFKDHMEEF